MLFESMDDGALIFPTLLTASHSSEVSWTRTSEPWEAPSIYIDTVRRLELECQVMNKSSDREHRRLGRLLACWGARVPCRVGTLCT